MFMIKEIPIKERPRERFIKESREAIQTYELIAIILRTGSHNQSVIELSKEIQYQFSSLKELSEARVSDLTKIKGIGDSKAIQLLAAFELGKRAHIESFKERPRLITPESIYLYLKNMLELKMQEHFIALYLNTKGELIKKEVLFIGSLNASLVHPREVFKHAVINSAAAIIIAHNHPSGDPTPSKNDIDVTKMIEENSEMMDIKLMDHIIIGRNKYFSFKEKGLL